MVASFRKKNWGCEIREFSMGRNHVLNDSSKMASASDPDMEARILLPEER